MDSSTAQRPPVPRKRSTGAVVCIITLRIAVFGVVAFVLLAVVFAGLTSGPRLGLSAIAGMAFGSACLFYTIKAMRGHRLR